MVLCNVVYVTCGYMWHQCILDMDDLAFPHVTAFDCMIPSQVQASAHGPRLCTRRKRDFSAMASKMLLISLLSFFLSLLEGMDTAHVNGTSASASMYCLSMPDMVHWCSICIACGGYGVWVRKV